MDEQNNFSNWLGQVPENIGSGISSVYRSVTDPVRRAWNTPTITGATPKYIAEGVLNLPRDFIRGIPWAKETGKEYVKTLGIPDIPFLGLAELAKPGIFPEWMKPRTYRTLEGYEQPMPTGLRGR